MGLHRAIAVAVASCCFIAAGMSAASAEGNRWALVIGITDYDNQASLKRLPNASRDAAKFASLLKSLGYAEADVMLLNTPELTTAQEIDTAWQDILARARAQRDGGTLVVYFAGHGIEIGGQNFLLPKEMKFEYVPETRQRDLDDIKAKAIVVQKLLADIAAVQDVNGMSALLILDACRNNPFKAVATQGAPISIGLAPPPKSAHEVFVMYSAGIGQEAIDGDAAWVNSLYLTEFLKFFPDGNTANHEMALSELAQTIRENVYVTAKSRWNHVQTPAYYDQFLTRRTIYGRPLTALVKPPDNKKFGDVATRGLSEESPVLIECSYCPELMLIPREGPFVMGDEDADRKAHPVTIGKNLAFGRFEVTVREWNQCVRDGDCSSARDESDPRVSLQPVTKVSWEDAKKFVGWLSRITKKTYRLPTEAEWEYAARAGSTTAYSFGDVERKKFCLYANGADQSAGALLDVNTTCDDGVGRKPAQRGSYLPNKWGLHDMHGNVWEWVQDCWNASYEGAPSDGSAWESGNCDAHVARGGSWRSAPEALRSAVRHNFPATHTRSTLGFRVVRELSDEEVEGKP